MKTFLSSVRGSLRPLALLFPLCTAHRRRHPQRLRQKVEKSFRVYATYGDGTSADVASQGVLTMDSGRWLRGSRSAGRHHLDSAQASGLHRLMQAARSQGRAAVKSAR